jgi:DNA-binding Lrp family transcriptional regulator
VDGLDVDILRHMGLLPFLAWPHPPENLRPGRVARQLGVSPDTVKDRIARLEAEGVIAGYEIHPNFRHLGVTATTFHFRVADPRHKARGVEDLRNVDGVVGVFDYLGPTVCVDLAFRHPRELERKVELVARLLMAEALPHPCFDYALPEVRRPLANLDWRIIRALRGRARRPPEDVGAEIGVSGRTVRRRLDRMAAEGCVDIIPIVDKARMSGYIMYEALVTLREGVEHADGLPPALARAFHGAVCAAWPMPERERRCATVLLLARSVAEIEGLRREVEAVPGVEHVEVLIPAGSVSRTGWVDEAIEARIRETEALSRTPAAAPGP